MCHFITIIGDKSEADILSKLISSQGRSGQRLQNKYLQKILDPDEVQFLAYENHCDCGTVLGQTGEVNSQLNLKSEAASLKKKGWSKTKIDRYLSDKIKASENRYSNQTDSYRYWAKFVELVFERNLTKVGVFVHFYGGALETERIEGTRKVAKYNSSVLENFKQQKEDEVLIFLKNKNLTA